MKQADNISLKKKKHCEQRITAVFIDRLETKRTKRVFLTKKFK